MGNAMMMKKKSKLPEELIVEIILKLPVKSLLRLRCVCKSWYTLIKSPNFINMHLKKSHKNILVNRGLKLSVHSYESLSIISSPYSQEPWFGYQIVACEPCNGLLCFSISKDIALCNPALREFKKLPPRPFPCPAGQIFYTVAIGLGFDSITNDYKVVKIVSLYEIFRNVNMLKAEIYNLGTNCWRGIDIDPNLKSVVEPTGFGTLFNGSYHRIGSSSDLVSDIYERSYVLSFDMSTEVFRGLDLPHIDTSEKIRRRLTVLDGSLGLFAYTYVWTSPGQQSIDIWVMQQYGVVESWTKKFTVGPVTELCCPFLLWKNEAVLMEVSNRLVNGRLVSCSLDTHEVNDFNTHGEPLSLNAMVYRESMIPIK